jgi:lambda repressor-like predicted transcriptional regulator
MNIYKYHANPESLNHHDVADEKVPHLVFKKYNGFYTSETLEALKQREHILAKDPHVARKYAKLFIRGRWPRGESAIARNAKAAVQYADEVLKGPFPEAEPVIAKDSLEALKYADRVLHDRFPEGEAAIAKNANFSYAYAFNVLHKRFPEGEKAISKDPEIASKYAIQYIKGPWPEAEDVIATDSEAAWRYACLALKGRFKKAEPRIMNSHHAMTYAINVIKGPWPEAEDNFAKYDKTAYEYATRCLLGRFYKGEPVIAKDEFTSKRYCKFFDIEQKDLKT